VQSGLKERIDKMVMTFEESRVNEKSLINKIVEIVATYGWILTKVYDGEEYIKCTTGDEAYKVCDSVDESSIRFEKGDDEHGVLIILQNGNSGFDLISDYNYSESNNFNEAMEKFSDFVNAEEEKYYG